MKSGGYTIILVESPVLARRLQPILPQYVVVIATKGFLWNPVFNQKTQTLGKLVVPEKADLRKKIRQEARSAVTIIIATDADPAGDFIAWSLFKHIKHNRIMKANLQSISKIGAEKLMAEASEIDFEKLHQRLENRYRIRYQWKHHHPGISMLDAGLSAIFRSAIPVSQFISDDGQFIYSSHPIPAKPGDPPFEVKKHNSDQYIFSFPPSTYEVVEQSGMCPGFKTYEKAQSALQELFETMDPHSGSGLITYPRTAERSYFSDVWQTIRNQWIKNRPLNSFIPASLQKTTAPPTAHGAIRPVDITVSPDWIQRHIPAQIGNIYKLIYSRTIDAISMPQSAASVFKPRNCKFSSSSIFYSKESISASTLNLNPLLSPSALGHTLNRLDVLRPSRFGTFMDDAIRSERILIDNHGNVSAGPAIAKFLNQAGEFRRTLETLQKLADRPLLKNETISSAFSS